MHPLPGWLGITLLGLTLGLKHALDPDHLAAVSATVARHPRPGRALIAGTLWGVGHAAMLLLVGGAVVGLGLELPPRAAAAAEALVGVVLVLVGIELALALRRERAHMHVHEHDGERHVHLHTHAHGPAHDHPHVSRRALLVGLAHGLAGSAGLTLLVAAATRSRGEAMAFLVLFALGSIAGMTMATAAVAIPLRWAGEGARGLLWLRAGSALLAIAVGSAVAYAATASLLG